MLGLVLNWLVMHHIVLGEKLIIVLINNVLAHNLLLLRVKLKPGCVKWSDSDVISVLSKIEP